MLIAVASILAAVVALAFSYQLVTILREARARRRLRPPKMVDLSQRKRSSVTIADFLVLVVLASFASTACGTTFAADAEKCTVASLPKAAADEVPVVVAAAQKDPTAWAKEESVLLGDLLPYAGCIAYAGYQALVRLLSHGQESIAGRLALDRTEVLARRCGVFPTPTK